MKTKILISLIILNLTAIVLVCSFIGCQEKHATFLQQPADEPGEKPVLADDSKKPDSVSQVMTEKQTELSKPQQVVSEDISSLQVQPVLVEPDKQISLRDSQKPLVTIDLPADPQDIRLSLTPESEETRVQVRRGQILAPADKLAQEGMVGGKDDFTYGMSDGAGDRYLYEEMMQHEHGFDMHAFSIWC